MNNADLPRDPIKVARRKAKAAERFAPGAKCSCGEARPEALIADTDPVKCAACQRRDKRQSTFDHHHVAGRANHPATVAVPVNDHRAILTAAQYDWARETFENPDGCPLLRAAACIRGTIDTIRYVVHEFLNWIADMLEALSKYLAEQFGPKWWLDTPLSRFAYSRWKQ